MNRKKIIAILILILILILSSIAKISMAAFTANVTSNKNLENINIGEEITYTIKLTEEIVACNFDISFDTKVLEFVSSETSNLTAAMNNGKLSCVYVDISQTGTTDLKLKFKKISTGNANIEFTNIKFRAKGQETSYTENDTKIVMTTLENVVIDENKTSENVGINDNKTSENVNESTDKTSTPKNTFDKTTTQQTKLPNTGIGSTALIISCTTVLIAIAIIMEKRELELKKIFKSVNIK